MLPGFARCRWWAAGALSLVAACGAESLRPDAARDARTDPPPDAWGLERDARIGAEASADDPVEAGTDAEVRDDASTTADAERDGGVCDGSLCDGACVEHRAAPNTCGTAENLGAFCGDASCGALCRATAYRAVAVRRGRSSTWIRASANECSLCSANLLARITLAVPPGADYDLFVHRPCGTLLSTSIRGPGEPEQLELEVTDRATVPDSFEYFIEVRHVGGASCEPWTLTVEARGFDGTTC
jgi:hypothetical protein